MAFPAGNRGFSERRGQRLLGSRCPVLTRLPPTSPSSTTEFAQLRSTTSPEGTIPSRVTLQPAVQVSLRPRFL